MRRLVREFRLLAAIRALEIFGKLIPTDMWQANRTAVDAMIVLFAFLSEEGNAARRDRGRP